jgi:hypothetical protein
VTIDGSVLPQIGGLNDLFWGGAWCSNDAIHGTFSIPDAGTLSLIGSAMVIAALFGRRKRTEKP